MTDTAQLRKLAETCIASQGSADWYEHYAAYDDVVTNPSTVLGLLDTIDRLTAERDLSAADIRAIGGIVHGDGNIFFTNIEQLNRAIRKEQP